LIGDQLCDALLVGGVGGEGDEFLFGVVGELEHDVLQVQVAEEGVVQSFGAGAERDDVVARPPGPGFGAGGL